MTANDNKSCRCYLNKLLDDYNNTYHYSIGKQPIDAGYFALTKEFKTNPEAPKFNRCYTENESRQFFLIWFKTLSELKPNSWTYKIKGLNGGTRIERFYEKELFQSILQMSCYPEPNSHIW